MNLTEIEKIAVLLIALGPQRSQRIIDRLSADVLAPVISAMKRIKHVPPETRRAVLEEVLRHLDGAADPQHADPSELLERIDWETALGFDPDAPLRPPEDNR